MTKQQIISNKCFLVDLQDKKVDCPMEDVEAAMDQWAKQQAIEFFKWNAKSTSEYLDYLRRVDKTEGLEEMELELNHFENNSIEGRYELFLKSKQP